MDRIKLPDVADLVRDGAQWDDLEQRLSVWRPQPAVEVVKVTADSVEGKPEDDIDAICAEVRAEMGAFTLAEPDEAVTAAPAPAPAAPAPAALAAPAPAPAAPATPAAPAPATPAPTRGAPRAWAASVTPDGVYYHPGADRRSPPRLAAVPAAPAAPAAPVAPSAPAAPAVSSAPATPPAPAAPSLSSKPAPRPVSPPSKLATTAKAIDLSELDPADPRQSVCDRLGEKPLVRHGDKGKEPMCYITSRCCPPPEGSGEKKLSLLTAASGDVLAKCWVCQRTAFPASLLRPLGELASELAAKPEPKAKPKPKAKPELTAKPKTQGRPEPKAEPEPNSAPKPSAPDDAALDGIIVAALAAGPRLRAAVVAQVQAAGIRAKRAELREARERVGVRSYTVAQQQWWALQGAPSDLGQAGGEVSTVATERWTN